MDSEDSGEDSENYDDDESNEDYADSSEDDMSGEDYGDGEDDDYDIEEEESNEEENGDNWIAVTLIYCDTWRLVFILYIWEGGRGGGRGV